MISLLQYRLILLASGGKGADAVNDVLHIRLAQAGVHGQGQNAFEDTFGRRQVWSISVAGVKVDGPIVYACADALILQVDVQIIAPLALDAIDVPTGL